MAVNDYFNLVITVPSGEEELDAELDKYLRKKSYSQKYFNGPIDTRQITFHSMDQTLIEFVKSQFRQMYSKSAHISKCSFNVLEKRGVHIKTC